MSAVFAPYGLLPVSRRLGVQPVPIVRRGAIASTYAANIGTGDPVKMITDGTYQLAAAGDAISAVFAGWSSDDPGVWQSGPNWKSGQTWTIPPWFKFYDPEVCLFRVQANGPIAKTAIGDCFDHVAGTVNANSGRSGLYLDTGTAAGAGNSAQYKVVDLWLGQGNDWGDAYTEVVVMINERNLGRVPGNAI